MSETQNQDTKTPETSQPADAGKESAAPSKEEWVANAKLMRENASMLKTIMEKLSSGQSESPEKSKPGKGKDAADEVVSELASIKAQLANMQTESTVTAAFLKHGITDPSAQELVRAATKSLKPDEIAPFVEKHAGLFKASGDVKKAVDPIKPGTSNTGAAGTDSKIVPNDIYALSKEAQESMPIKDLRDKFNNREHAQGGNVFRKQKG